MCYKHYIGIVTVAINTSISSAIQKKFVNSRLPIFAYFHRLLQCTHCEYALFLMFCERKALPKELAICVLTVFFCASMI